MSSNGAAGPRPRQFTASKRRELLAQVVGQHTGIIARIFGVDFDLVALSSAELLSVLGIIENVADMLQGEELSDVAILRVIGKDGSRVMTFMHDLLQRSADLADDDERAVFEEWWEAVPIVAALKILAPALLEANGITLKGPLAKMGGAPTSEQSTPSDSSSPTPVGTRSAYSSE
jgi:hypothetical protein